MNFVDEEIRSAFNVLAMEVKESLTKETKKSKVGFVTKMCVPLTMKGIVNIVSWGKRNFQKEDVGADTGKAFPLFLSDKDL